MNRAVASSRLTGARLLGVLGSLTAVGALALDMYLPAFPEMATDLGAEPAAIQLTLTACLIGLGLGQVVGGPLSDVHGRRKPLLGGLAAFTLASLACAVAPSVYALIALRTLQGLAGGVGIVIGRAIVRDLHSGAEAARLFSRLMLIIGVSPILAPLIGAQLLEVTSWRSIFLALAATGVALALAAATWLPETLPPAMRHAGGLRETATVGAALVRNRAFVGYVLTGTCSVAATFAYLAGAPFVLQDIYGASPQLFSLLFGLNAIGMVAASQVNAHLVRRVPLDRLTAFGLTAAWLAALVLLAVVLAGDLGLGAIVAPLFVMLASYGFVGANTAAMALHDQGRAAGSASALAGLVQFGLGAAIVPLVGVGGRDTALPLALVVLALTTLAPIALISARRRPWPRAPRSAA